MSQESDLRSRLKRLRDENRGLRDENRGLRDRVEELLRFGANEIEFSRGLRAEIAETEGENQRLRSRIQSLEAQTEDQEGRTW